MEKFCMICNVKINETRLSKLKKRKFCSHKCEKKWKSIDPNFNQQLSKKQKVKCDYCGKEMSKRPSHIGKTNFCNKICNANYRNKIADEKSKQEKKKYTLSCELCKKDFFSEKPKKRFCSPKCIGGYNAIRNKGRNSTKVKINCSNCGKEFLRKPSELKAETNYCSYDCMGEHYAKTGRFSGENNGTWQGGDIDYYGPNWRDARRETRKRDNYKCQDCGITEEEYGQELSVHHIKRFRDCVDYKEANQLNNLVSVCEPCHRIRHSKDYTEVLVDDRV